MSLKPLEPQHWPFLLWKCTTGCSRPTTTCCCCCCLVEWPSSPALLLSVSFLKTAVTVAALWKHPFGALFSRKGTTTCSWFMWLILCLYFGNLSLLSAAELWWKETLNFSTAEHKVLESPAVPLAVAVLPPSPVRHCDCGGGGGSMGANKVTCFALRRKQNLRE